MKRAIIIAAVAILLASTIWSGAQMFAQLFAATGTPIPAVAWYKLDGNALDSSGNGYDGTWTGTEAYTNGLFAGTQAASFSESSIGLGRIFNQNLTNVTISAWIRPNVASRDFLTLGTSFYRYNNATSIRIYRVNGSSGYNITGFDNALNSWNHIAIVMTSSGAKGYRNGVYVGETSEIQKISPGNSFIGLSGFTSFSGALSDVRIFDRALSEDNIKRIMESQDNEPLEELQ